MRLRALLAALLLGGPVQAQAVRVGVEPAVVTVGEPFHLVAESLADRGARLELRVAADSAGRFEVTRERGADPSAGIAWVRVVAWRTGPQARLDGALRITGPDGRTREVPLQLQTPVVRSVLPADTGRIPPRPPRDVLGADRVVLWWAVAAGAALLLLVLAHLWRRRRLRAPVRAGAGADPRADALRALERIRRSDLLARGEVRRFYEETAEVVRGFAAAWSGEWSRDLTSGELLARLRAAAAPGSSALAEVLGAADLAKFAARTGDAESALREWEIARAWIAEQGGPR